jgi:hypothetical protein
MDESNLIHNPAAVGHVKRSADIRFLRRWEGNSFSG